MDRLAIASTNIKRDTETLKVLKMLYKLRENENPNRYNKDTKKTIEILSTVYTTLENNNQNDPMVIHTGTIIYEIKASSTPNLITETTLDAMKKLAEYCRLKSMINSALSIYRAIVTHKKINSSGNYDVEFFAIIEEMGTLYFLNRFFAGSENCFKQLLNFRRNAKTISTMIYLMKVYDEQKNYSECIKLINAYDYTIDEKLKIEIKIVLIEIKSHFANIYFKAGNYHDAKQYLQDCIEKFQKYHGDNWKFPEKKYPQILLIMYQLGKIQMVLKEYDEAEKCFRKCYSLRMIISGARDSTSRTEEAMKSLLNCYRTQGKEEQAEILLMHYEDAKTAAFNKAIKKIAKKNSAQASNVAAAAISSTKIVQISNP
jgi:tetratricopeptide (TPR) repeat protein